MDKIQCLLFRKTSTETLLLEVPSGGTVTVNSLMRDLSTGVVGEHVVNTITGPATPMVAALSGSLNDRCLEELNVLNHGASAVVVTVRFGINSNAHYPIWKGTLQPNQRLRYRETLGFHVV